MASTLFSYGYLEASYMVYAYGTETSGVATFTQVQFKIADVEKAVRTQASRQIADDEKPILTQANRELLDSTKIVRSQATPTVGNIENKIYTQADRFLGKMKSTLSQANLSITGNTKAFGMQVKIGNVLHLNCEEGGYLALDYLSVPYLTTFVCAHLRAQVSRKTTHENIINTQVERRIDTEKHLYSQVDRKILDVIKSINTQVSRAGAKIVRTQVRKALYNVTNLRILWEFPSRGDGTSWTSNSTMAGDYSPDNMNTDIVEQIWKSNSSTSGINLNCDCGNPVFVDTLAILNHNMTRSASITFQGADNPGFSPVGFSTDLTAASDNIYYIAPDLPTDSYRYWRIQINDVTNTEGFISIGTIVFGSATIFQGECFVDRVQRSLKHFSDKIETEGFTNVSNDRALKAATGLEFRNLRFNRGNYNNIRQIFEEMRTSLKALWIPTPQYPSRFAVFGKLKDMPTETHNVKGEDLDFVDFTIEVDESL